MKEKFKMNEKLKKSILIVVMIVSVFGIVLTINHAKSNLSSNANNAIKMGEMSGTPPEMSSDRGQNMGESPSENNTEKGNPPESPNGNNSNGNMVSPPNGMMKDNQAKLSVGYIIVIASFSGLFSLSLIYLLMSLKNKKFYKNKDKVIIYILGNIILITSITIGTTLISNNFILKNDQNMNESSEKDKVVLDKSNVVSDSSIDLNKQKVDVTITSGGTYTFTGSFEHSIIIDADNEEVEIILNGVDIKNEETAAIIGLSASKLKITLEDGTTNTLNDGGNSEYDGCIFSNVTLEFDGNGTLYVNGNQNEGEGIATEAQNITFNNGTYIITSNDDGINAGGDGATITFNDGTFYIDASGDGIDSNKDAVVNGGTIFVMGSDVGGDAGIDTDDGFTINGGFVVALGTDMIETPLDSSKQKTIAFTLNESISKDTIVTLMKGENVIVSFSASKSFKTIIISSDKIDDGEYSLYTGGSNSGKLVNGIYINGTYKNGEKVTVNNSTTFNVSKTINLFGKSGR